MLEILLAGTRENVEQALQKYERAIAAILKSSLDRDWKDEDLYAVAQIAANAITWRDREIKQLKEDVCVLKDIEGINSSTSSLALQYQKVQLQKLAAYFEKRARENEKRANKLEKEIREEFSPWDNYTEKDRSSYYLSGKADAYKRAAEKVREVLGEPKAERVYEPVEPKPAEKWVVECQRNTAWGLLFGS
jgi:hypothetical protein